MEEIKKEGAQGLSKISESEQKSWIAMALVWAGAAISVPPLMVGGFMATGLGMAAGTWAMIACYVFCVIFMIFMSFQAVDLGVPTVIMVSGGFGKNGSRFVISSILTITFVAWFGMQCSVCGEAFSGLIELFGVRIPGWLSIVIWGAIMTYTAVKGIDSIKFLNTIAVPGLVIALIYAVIYTLSDPENLSRVMDYRPEQPMGFWAATSMGIGGFAGFTVFSGDFTRFCKSRKDVVLSCLTGIIPCGAGILIIGGALALSTGALGFSNDMIVKMLSSMGTPLIGLFVLILATWTTNVATAYSTGFSMLNLTRAHDSKRPLFTLICGCTGIVLSIAGILDLFTDFINILAAFLPTIMGIAIMDYFVICKGKAQNWSPIDGVNWAGVISWLAGSAVAFAFPSLFLPVLNGIVITSLLYLILYRMFYKKTSRKI